jgi:hypothetical protein
MLASTLACSDAALQNAIRRVLAGSHFKCFTTKAPRAQSFTKKNMTLTLCSLVILVPWWFALSR